MNIVITGASKGIGFAMAKRFALNGHTVIALARSASLLTKLEQEVKQGQQDSRIIAMPFDLQHGDIKGKLHDEIGQRFNHIDVLINNAGFLVVKPFHELTDEDFDQSFDINVKAVFRMIRDLGSLTLILDCYNANPQSLRAALDLLETVQVLGSRVAVLGSMLELGPDHRLIHRKALENALERRLDLIIATGLFAEAAEWVTRSEDQPELLSAPKLEEAEEILHQRLGGTEVVLLKASRGVAMESLVPGLEERFGPVGGEA